MHRKSDHTGSGEAAASGALDPQRWLDEHGDVLWRFALSRVRSAQVAEDLIQETFLSALKGQEGFEGKSSERTWLVSILRHKIADWQRQRGRRADTDESSAAPVDVLDTMFDEHGRWKVNPGRWPRNPERVLEEPEFWQEFERCLSQLPAGLAEAFVLREVRTQAAEAVCAALSITLENLWVRLHRARALLRKCLEPHWGKGGKAGREGQR